MKKWMVLIMAFMSVVMSTGFPFNMSVLYVEWLDEFKKSNSETALVQSICTGIFSLGGSINGIIVTKFGPCRCGIAGGIVAAAGLAISYFATSIYFLVLSVGIVTGFGLSLSFISASTSVGLYFDGKQRLMALALVSTGGGFKGLTRTDAVSIYFYMNVMSTVFRFVTGLLKQIPHVSVIAIPVFCALLGASSMGLFPLVGSSYIANLLVAFMYGCGRGGMFAVLGISIVKLAGPENYSVALGISMTFSGILNAVAGPVSGVFQLIFKIDF
ncbi:SLC16A9 [Mytilus edulis]|uniref:SLC16A9 n=1 Tax=Mytilus edulis TaxID=6550 RepID=A0A8S3TGN4_MYTED|nr:SLC16A9 [Mytilus edulis]